MHKAPSDPDVSTLLALVLHAASRCVEQAAKLAALAAGLILIALIAIVAISVTGRALAPFGLSSIRGDYELVSAGVAVAAFLSFGWTQIQGGHATVDLLVERFPGPLRRIVTAAAHLTIASAGAFLCWRLAYGAMDRAAYGETMQLSRLPLVWPYLAAALGAGILALAGLRSAALALMRGEHAQQ